MKWLTKWGYAPKCVRHIEKYQNGILDLFDIGYMPRRGYRSGTKLWENMGLGRAGEGFPGRQALGLHRLFGRQPVRHEYSLSRDWLAQLWVADKRADRIKQKCQRGGLQNVGGEERAVLGNANGSWSPFLKQFKPFVNITVQDIDELLGSRFGGDSVPPTSPEEVKLAPLLARSDLLITRDIEWANLMFAFEQENRYKVVDPYHPRFPVGSIHEQSNIIFRQLLRTRRPFVAYVVDADGNEIFQIRRPFWWINSTIYAEVDGKEIGVVHRRWHLWRRIYDLYLGKKQFAVVENPGFWNWTFTLKDEDERVLAEINRDWRGFGLELFTDAGQYVIRFGPSKDSMSLEAAIPELEVGRQLTLSERAVAVSLAVSLDCDYFSRHGGWGLPIFIAGE